MKGKWLVTLLAIVLAFTMVGCQPGNLGGTEKAEKGTLVVVLPEEFEKTESDGYTYYQKKDVGSNVVVNSTKNDGSLKRTTAKMLLTAMKPQLEATYGTSLELKLLKESKVTISGHEGLMYSFSYTVLGLDVVQTQYILENDDIYEFVTFTDITSEGYTSVFDDCAKKLSYK